MAAERFLVRVELHGVNRKDSDVYERLHKEMEALGFVRFLTIRSKSIPLPHATYKYSGVSTPQEVRNKAVAAANAALASTARDALPVRYGEKKPMVIVTKYNSDTMAHNLC